MSRNLNKALRLKELQEMLARRPRRVVELARRFEVSRRTVERDLQDLRESGVAIMTDDDGNHSIESVRGGLNQVEALAVHSATRLLVHHAQINERHYRTALEKLAMQLPEPARASVHKSVDALQSKSSRNSRHLDQVAQAWFENRLLKFDYRSAGSRSGNAYPQVLEVYFFEISRTNLAAYVIGFERNYHQQVRIFKLDRMQNLSVLEEHYEIPVDFDPHEFLSGAWGIVVGDPVHVKLRFSDTVRQQITELPSQNLHVLPDDGMGGLLVEARASATSRGAPVELLSWIRGWGSLVEVLEPPEVREAIAMDLRQALEAY